MRKVFIFLLIYCFILPVNAAILEAGVSVNEIPKEFFGSWRVNGKLDRTDSYSRFRAQSIDFWNLSRKGDIVRLENPMSGADAEISIQTVENNLIIFVRKTPYDTNKVLTDTVNIRLDGNNFSGINTLKLEQFSLVDGHLMKTENALYKIEGEKLSGETVIEN